jgi:nuclear transcription factor Y, gamma
MEESQEPSGGVKRPATDAPSTETNSNVETAQPPPAKKPAATASSVTPAQAALQRQIQQQLQEQLQQQLQAAAARGQQAHITPAQIQAQAAAMVQAAAQAQAVVAAAKARSPNNQLQPMSASQISALSQIQAAAIVNSRRTSAASADSKKPDLTPAQIQTQIQIQAQALIHAHTQAQIQAGIYKGDDTTTAAKTPATTTAPTIALPPAAAAISKSAPLAAPALHTDMPPAAPASLTNMVAAVGLDPMDLASQDSNSPAFQQQLSSALQEFWTTASAQIRNLSNQTEQDFKTHNDLPLARIKRIMKSDEDVRMISAEAPVLFAKACELFILDLSVRSWNYSQLHKRRTLQKEDVKEAIQKTEIFDFLVDVIQ